MTLPFSLGCNGRGVMHLKPVSVDEQFAMLKSTGVFDHFDRMPQPGVEQEYIRAAEKHAMPMRTGLWSYMVGRDEALVLKNLEFCKAAGAECHNLMIYRKHVAGRDATDREIADFYRLAYEAGAGIGITIGLEVHIYMWSEDFRRINKVAQLVRAEGLPFNFILDHSHILLKVDNPEEQDASDIREDVEAGALVIDPYEPGNVIDDWISQQMTIWLQVRPVSPNGPKNRWMTNDLGQWGRACQYPFVKPKPGEWHSVWNAYRVEPCKDVVRRVLRAHRDNPDGPLRWLTTDMIDMADYGGNAKYSLLDQNVAIADWIRSTWAEIAAEPAAKERKAA